MDKSQKAPQGVTNAATFKKLAERRKGTVVELPSGLKIKVSKPQISDMLVAGEIPGELINVATGQLPEGTTTKEQAAKNSQLLFHVVAKAVVEPKVLLTGEPDYDKGEISIQDLTDIDRSFIYAYVQEGVSGILNSFRDEQPSENSRPDSAQVSGHEAKPASRSK